MDFCRRWKACIQWSTFSILPINEISTKFKAVKLNCTDFHVKIKFHLIAIQVYILG